MDSTEIILYLIFDNFLSQIIFPIHYPFVEMTIKIFHNLPNDKVFLFANVGNILGHSANLFLGRIMRSVKKDHNKIKLEEILSKFYTKYAYFIMILSPIFFLGGINSVLAGWYGEQKTYKYLLCLSIYLIIYSIF